MASPVIETGSVRVDLLGGTIDLWPMNLILKDVVTLNLATTLKAKVLITKNQDSGLEIISKDYHVIKNWKSGELTKTKILDGSFEEWSFVLQIIQFFGLVDSGLVIELESGSPPSAGLGGSSAMGITLYKTLCKYLKRSYENDEALKIVSNIEARILNCGPTGHQDYYPALYGGILALHSKASGVEVEQLYNDELALILKKRTTLVYTGEKRLSGINNWEVYKRFFDGDKVVISGLEEIAALSYNAYKLILDKKYDEFIEEIKKEGLVRKELFSGIMTPSMIELFENLSSLSKNIGIKVCGAGGGGCFLLIHSESDRIIVEEEVKKTSMKILNFEVDRPYL